MRKWRSQNLVRARFLFVFSRKTRVVNIGKEGRKGKDFPEPRSDPHPAIPSDSLTPSTSLFFPGHRNAARSIIIDGCSTALEGFERD